MSASAAAGEGGGVGGKEKGPGGACELCGAAARVYCGADEATLCWGCDAQVHGANFLVARHARALLCRGCARPTPWRAAGPRLGPTASLCNHCVRRGGAGGPAAAGAGGVGADVEMGGGRGDGDEEDDDDGEDEVVVEDEEDEEEEEEGEGENQVVPWTEEEAGATPPPVASSTSSSSREAAANGANAGDCAKVRLLPCFRHSCSGACKFANFLPIREEPVILMRNVAVFLSSRRTCRARRRRSRGCATTPRRRATAAAGATRPPPHGTAAAGSSVTGTGRDRPRISSARGRRSPGVVRPEGIAPTPALAEMDLPEAGNLR
ncbi:unnamed protein product [Urochloa decumbens]|uniref:B box-type domain-containing protein n=1 Tax=Urochloa decumbens TaxID=240449 RepID=A0ABC9BXV2_9POAL